MENIVLKQMLLSERSEAASKFQNVAAHLTSCNNTTHLPYIHAIVHILHSPSTYLSMECIWSQERATAPHKHFAYIIEFMYSVFHVPWTNSQERWYFLVNIYATNCTRTKLQKKANVQFVMCTLCKVHLYISWRANGAILNVWIAFVEWIPVRCNSETD